MEHADLSNVRHLFGGEHADPDDVLDQARGLNPRFLLISLVDETGRHVTLMSNITAPEVCFLLQSSQAQISQFLLGRST